MGNKTEKKSPEKTTLTRLVQFIEDQSVQIYATIAAALFALNGVFFSIHYTMGIIDILLAVLFFVQSLRGSARANRSTRALSGRIKSLQEAITAQREALKSYLVYLIETMYNGELDFKQSERISVFEITSSGFELVARFSANPELCKPARTHFPADYGIIAVAFRAEDGEAFDFKLPDPAADFEAYAERQNAAWKVPKTHLKNMRMKPRDYAAFVVRNSLNKQASGVVLFESEQPGKLGKEKTRKAATGCAAVDIGNILGFTDVGE